MPDNLTLKKGWIAYSNGPCEASNLSFSTLHYYFIIGLWFPTKNQAVEAW